jgi:hypothetical protein
VTTKADLAFAPAPDVVFRDLDGEAVVLDLATGMYFGLDDVGTRMWQLIEQHGTLPEVLDILEQEFDAPIECVEADLREFLDLLVSKGLVRPVGPR